MGRFHIGDPVTDRFIDRVLQRARPAFHRPHLRAEELHAIDVRCLPGDVFRAHVHDALEPELRADRRRRHAMLAGAGLGDDPPFPQSLGEERLAERVVDLVRARVGEVLTLEQDLRPTDVRAQPLGAGARGGASSEAPLHLVQLAPEGRVAAKGEVRLGELRNRWDQHLRNIGAAELPEPAVDALRLQRLDAVREPELRADVDGGPAAVGWHARVKHGGPPGSGALTAAAAWSPARGRRPKWSRLRPRA